MMYPVETRAKPHLGPWCPKCGAPMGLKTPRPGGSMYDPFYGCTMYPLCKGTRNCDEYTGAPLLTSKEIEAKRMKEYLEVVNDERT
jgi:ssDNA-binding Zn-finger/Zn-ribbon topoisomerase 1